MVDAALLHYLDEPGYSGLDTQDNPGQLATFIPPGGAMTTLAQRRINREAIRLDKRAAEADESRWTREPSRLKVPAYNVSRELEFRRRPAKRTAEEKEQLRKKNLAEMEAI